MSLCVRIECGILLMRGEKCRIFIVSFEALCRGFEFEIDWLILLIGKIEMPHFVTWFILPSRGTNNELLAIHKSQVLCRI